MQHKFVDLPKSTPSRGRQMNKKYLALREQAEQNPGKFAVLRSVPASNKRKKVAIRAQATKINSGAIKSLEGLTARTRTIDGQIHLFVGKSE